VSERPRLGDVLVAHGSITRERLTEALARQRVEGERLGAVLLSDGDVGRRELFVALAESWGVPVVDLITDPPDSELIGTVEPEQMLRERWVPHRLEHAFVDGVDHPVLVVATADVPGERLEHQVSSVFPAYDVRVEATTDWDIDQAVLLGREEAMIEAAAEGLARENPDFSARNGWVPWHIATFLLVMAAFITSAVVAPKQTLIALLVAVNVMFFVGVAFKVVACASGMVQLRRIERADDPRRGRRLGAVPRIPDHELPRYTILVPAYREAYVVSKVIEHINALDYPRSKLQVLLLMEADDTETIVAAKAAKPPDYVRFVVVPAGGPQTKPKACNVGLALADGEFLVIYDAEDRPEPAQLREVVARFAEATDDVVCFQARLNYFNARENILTRMFTLEYSFWFDYMLPGLDAWHLPIPLGGTSNHFRTQALRDLGGWDPYNVTEDADLGIRASAVGLTVGITDSTTWEEACSEWRAWIRQRTRWIKGYMVTSLVHLRRPFRLARQVGIRGLVGLLGLIAGTPAMFLACPLVWASWLYFFLGGTINDFHLPGWLELAGLASFVLGNGLMILFTALAARRRHAYDLMPFSLLNPLYWLLHSFAAWRALAQLIVSPFHWEKTPHGIVHGAHRPKVERRIARFGSSAAAATPRGWPVESVPPLISWRARPTRLVDPTLVDPTAPRAPGAAHDDGGFSARSTAQSTPQRAENG
jgi:cellulose synthase/poly-beta-1,6-N-acetylglucosamine synthase-like glycosyltransferase